MTVYKMVVRIYRRYWLEVVIYLVLFLGFVMFSVGRPVSQGALAQTIEPLKIAVVNQSQSKTSQDLINYLKFKHDVTVTAESVVTLKNDVFLSIFNGLVIIPENFETAVLSGKADQVEIFRDERMLSTSKLEMSVASYLRLLNSLVKSNPQATLSELIERLHLILDQDTSMELVAIDNHSEVTVNYTKSIALMSYFILQIILSMVGMVMREVKAKRMQDRINFSGLSSMALNGQLFLGILSFGMVLLPIFFGVIWSYIPRSIYIDYLRIGISLTLMVTVGLSMAFMVTSITIQRHQLHLITTVVSLGLAFLSGLFIPYELLSAPVQRIAQFSPLFYFRQSVMKDIENYGDLKVEWGSMIIFSIVFVVLGIAISHGKRKSTQQV